MNHSPLTRIPWHVGATLLLLTATLAASVVTSHRRSDLLARPLEAFPRQLAGFEATDNRALTPGELHALQATSYISRTYRRLDFRADLFIAYYAQQRAGESMHSPKHCLPGAGWEIWDYGNANIVAGGRTYTVNKYSIAAAGERKLVLYWYQSKDRIIASEYTGKILLARDALLHNSTAASIVRIIVPDQPGALDAARAFASEVIPQMQLSFGAPGA